MWLAKYDNTRPINVTIANNLIDVALVNLRKILLYDSLNLTIVSYRLTYTLRYSLRDIKNVRILSSSYSYSLPSSNVAVESILASSSLGLEEEEVSLLISNS